jgi:hypothetical protein
MNCNNWYSVVGIGRNGRCHSFKHVLLPAREEKHEPTFHVPSSFIPIGRNPVVNSTALQEE